MSKDLLCLIDLTGMVMEDYIPSKILEKHKLLKHVEDMFIELNFRKFKWLLFGTCHSLSQNDQYYILKH